MKIKEVNIPRPCSVEVDRYLDVWDKLEKYRLQESDLDKLFFQLCPENKNIDDILIKASALNDFYSTNIFSIFPVAKHILNLDIDSRLNKCDPFLVSDIQHVCFDNEQKTYREFYSFASKYCSHHKPLDFPIYDSYVDEMLRYFRKADNFCDFKNQDLKNYVSFKKIILEFSEFYKLDSYSLKDIDRYLWQLGKKFFGKYR